MTFTNYDTKEINCKVVYFGPRGCGKTENLRSVFRTTSKEVRSGVLELTEEASPTPFFDFLPVSLGHVNDYHLKLHLYAMSTAVYYETVTSVLLKGVDGFVFVADSRIEALADNIRTMGEVKNLLTDHGYNVADMPRVIQYNKRDLNDVVPVDLLRQELNPTATYDHEAVATQSRGTVDTLQSLAKLLLSKLSH